VQRFVSLTIGLIKNKRLSGAGELRSGERIFLPPRRRKIAGELHGAQITGFRRPTRTSLSTNLLR
jgi:hypothetical protein